MADIAGTLLQGLARGMLMGEAKRREERDRKALNEENMQNALRQSQAMFEQRMGQERQMIPLEAEKEKAKAERARQAKRDLAEELATVFPDMPEPDRLAAAYNISRVRSLSPEIRQKMAAGDWAGAVGMAQSKQDIDAIHTAKQTIHEKMMKPMVQNGQVIEQDDAGRWIAKPIPGYVRPARGGGSSSDAMSPSQVRLREGDADRRNAKKRSIIRERMTRMEKAETDKIKETKSTPGRVFGNVWPSVSEEVSVNPEYARLKKQLEAMEAEALGEEASGGSAPAPAKSAPSKPKSAALEKYDAIKRKALGK